MAKTTKQDGFLNGLAKAIGRGVVAAFGPELKSLDERLAEIEARVDPTDLVDLQEQVGEEITKGLAAFKKGRTK